MDSLPVNFLVKSESLRKLEWLLRETVVIFEGLIESIDNTAVISRFIEGG